MKQALPRIGLAFRGVRMGQCEFDRGCRPIGE